MSLLSAQRMVGKNRTKKSRNPIGVERKWASVGKYLGVLRKVLLQNMSLLANLECSW